MLNKLFLQTILFVLIAIAGANPASAILVRSDYDQLSNPTSAVASNFSRYVSLANQTRFETVGAISINTAGSTGTCTGTLISSSIVLTAAHCFAGIVDIGTQKINAGTKVDFLGGPAIRVPSLASGVYSTPSISFSGAADRVWIHPTADIALARVPTVTGIVPTTYLPLYNGFLEAASPPSFAVTIGYGRLGNGLIGEVSGTTGIKLAGLSEIDLSGTDKLSSTFYRQSLFGNFPICDIVLCAADDPRTFPSNFLQAAPARGDSGGPLIANIGGVNAILGTVIGGGSVYGETNNWQRISSFFSDIEAESLALSGASILEVSGGSVTSPLFASSVVSAVGSFVKNFFFLGSVSPIYLDPPAGDYEEISINEGPSISTLFVPFTVPAALDLWTFDSTLGDFIDVGDDILPGSSYDFGPSGSRKFRLYGLGGISSAVLGFSFVDAGIVDLDWVSFSEAVLPPDTGTPVTEPTGMFALSCLVLGLTHRYRRRSQVAPSFRPLRGIAPIAA